MKSGNLIIRVCAIVLLICLSAAAFAQESSVVLLPTSLQIIEDEAFMGTTEIDKVVVVEGTTSIGSRAFADSSLTEITLPASLTYIADDAFSGCTADLTVNAEEGTYAYSWAVSMGYIESDDVTGPYITQSAWSGDVLDARIAIYQRSSQGAWEDIWWWDFCREYFKINFTVDQVIDVGTYKSEALMGGTMPDVFYQLFFNNNALVENGDYNGYLLDFTPYLNSSTMPNITKIFNANPGYKDMLKTQTGAIYGLGAFGNPETAQMSFYINQRWLNDAGLAMPSTLDEFEAAMDAFLKRGDSVVPIGGDAGNGPRLLANALGWNCKGASYLTSACVFGEGDDAYADFIYGNQEMFPIFLEYYKKWYDAGYFSPNLFDGYTAGNEESTLKQNDLVGVSQNTSMTLDSSEWTHVKWMTSEWNPTPQVDRSSNAINNASVVMDAALVNESALLNRLIKWVDWHYDYENYQISHMGPSAEDTEWLLGLESGWTATKSSNGRYTFTAAEVENGTYSSIGDYQNKRVQGIIGGYVGLIYPMFGTSWPNNGTSYQNGVVANSLPYIEDGFPNLVFLDMDEVMLVSEKSYDISTYVNEQLVNFVTGVTEINDANLADYFAQLDALGYQEYKAVYTNYYNNYKGN